MYKMCSKCEEEKDINEFSLDKSKKDGYKGVCRECTNKTRYINRNNNKDLYLEEQKNYYKNNKEEIKIKRHKYYIENKYELLEQKKEYYIENKESILLYKKKYGQTEKGMELSRLASSKRRTLKISTSDGTINLNSTAQMLSDQGGVCNYCGLDITDRSTRHLDHIIPISKGGPHSIDNVQWLCCDCNLIKSDKIYD